MSVNGEAFILDDRAKALANYPHMRKANGLLFVSGISSRRPDNTYEGVTVEADGKVTLDIKAQTKAVIENIQTILKSGGADLANIIDMTVFLVDMKDYAGFNQTYNNYFNADTGPTRTTVAVHQLPNPNLLIEIKSYDMTETKMETTLLSPLEYLPFEVFHIILNYIEDQDIESSFQYVSQTVYHSCQDDSFWKLKSREKFQTSPKLKSYNHPQPWKDFYFENIKEKYLIIASENGIEKILDVQMTLKVQGIQNVEILNINGYKRLPENIFQYDAILFFSYCGFFQKHVGDELYDFVQSGGGVVLGTYSNCGGGNRLEGKWLENNYDPITGGSTSRMYKLKLGKRECENHPVLMGVDNFCGGGQSSHSDGTLSTGATLIASWENGRPLIAETPTNGAGKIVSLNFYPPSDRIESESWTHTSDGAKLLANSLRYVRGFTSTTISTNSY
ncbi:2-Aminomuconate deaminase [Cavenderia fasciculata]|uniref:2-Aminomuconate deaminase n=1 Tax=Cavenderia fasciculata TaxID=261658 RepID=F4Q8A5_CACFS|nr:2-Aminomuconate deaminase [Cavenderia fasciculata]EGG16005.1 2-Aminomuconate deaminase [Cavenderia fasciculata]|eukprot:XP_004352330.1 2-Aminomuconate deaminase [Cavenderia fasciculata]